MNRHTHDILSILEQTLNDNFCYKLAKKHKFIQRSSSRLLGHEFIKTLILPTFGVNQESLGSLCIKIREFNPDADISAQALSERINNKFSVNLMKDVFSIFLQNSRVLAIEKDPQLKKLLEHFSDIIIEDSTFITLHEQHAKKYPGSNRCNKGGTTSQVKIDLIHSIAKGCIVDALVCQGKIPDQELSKRIIPFLTKNCLVIRDLGYFVLDVFKKIIEVGAYFISRLQPNVKIFLNQEDKTPLDVGKYILENFRYQKIIEFKGFLGDAKLPSRIVIYKAPEDVKSQRLRQANKRAKETGRALSKNKKLLTSYSIFVTNIPHTIVSAEIIGTIYRIRWEAELIFKLWKSHLHVHVFKGLNTNRIDCLIWARLSMVILISMICSWFNTKAKKCFDEELSPVKLINYLMRGDGFLKAIINYKLENYFELIEEDIPRRLCKDKRQRKTMRQRVADSEEYYEWATCA